MSTIENIIKNCKENFNLNVDSAQKTEYQRFLRRQLEHNPVYLNDKLLLFSYLTGRTAITINRNNYKKRIGRYKNKRLKPVKARIDDLELLSTKFLGAFDKEYRTDLQLYHLYGRAHAIRGGGWAELFNELGKDKEIQKYFRKRISYKDVMQERV